MDIPTTWEELKEGAKLMNDPANGFLTVLDLPWLARPAEEMPRDFAEPLCTGLGRNSGETKNGKVTVNSPETLEALKFIAKLVAREGLIPPDAITGDDSWNNNAYLAGTVGVITNSGSVVSSAEEEKPDLRCEHTDHRISRRAQPERRIIPGRRQCIRNI
ncbi:MAG: hypothetical protein ACLTBV_30510 [Enterocloster bolteae]